MYKVLIVDDCADDLNGLVSYVPWADFNCEVIGTATNGFDGISLAFRLRPHIVITDVSMPQKSGIEMAESIGCRLPETLFIYMSCFSAFEYAKKAVNSNALAYILKPIDIDELQQALQKVVDVLDERTKHAQRYEYLNDQFMKNKAILRENYLLSVLQGTEKDKNHRELLNFSSSAKYNICVLKTQSPENTGLDVLYEQQAYIREQLDKYLPGAYCVKFELDKIVAVVDETGISKAEFAFQKVQSLLGEKFTDTSLLVYITYDSFVFDEFPKQFQSLINIINNNYFEMREQIIYIDIGMLNSQIAGSSLSVSMIYDDVYSVLNCENEPSFFGEKYFFDNSVMDSVYLKSLCYLVICVVNVFLIEQNRSFNDIFGDNVLVWNKLANFQSIKNVKQWLLNILSAVRSFASESQTVDKTTSVVSEIKSYIDKNYANFNVVEEAVNLQGISLNYARKIFKSKEGKTIFDYLINKRMAEAKRLLITTNMPVNEIAEHVGYFSNTYFSTAFKKYTGINPQKYRDEN